MRWIPLLSLLGACDTLVEFEPNLPNPPVLQVNDSVTSTSTTTAVVDGFASVAGELDLLVVVDDSASMMDERDQLPDAAGPLLDMVSELALDAHIGIVTTDMAAPERSGLLVTDDARTLWIDATTPSPEASFVERLAGGQPGQAADQYCADGDGRAVI